MERIGQTHVAGAAAGASASASSSVADGPTPTAGGVAAGEAFGAMPGAAHFWVAEPGARGVIDIWRVGPAMPTAIGSGDAAFGLAGTGTGGRKC